MTNPKTVPEMLEYRLLHDPDAFFLLTPDGAGLTYREVAVRASQIGDRLRSLGVVPGDTVGLYLGNEPAWVVAMFGIWAAGGRVAACGTVSPPEEARRRFGLAGARVAIAATALDGFPAHAQVVVGSFGELTDNGPDDPSADAPIGEAYRASPEGVAFILFSSGTTGDAKAIVMTHGHLADRPSLTAGTYSSSSAFRPRTSGSSKPPAISFNPFGQAASIGRLVFRLYVGRPLVLVAKFDVEVLRELASRYPLDTLQLTPAMIYALAYTDTEMTLGALKYVNSGTAPLSSTVRTDFERRYGVPILQSYGSSEAGVLALETYEDAIAGRRGPGSVGRITAGVELRIVDDAGNQVPDGVDGEITRRVAADQETQFLTAAGASDLPKDAHGWYRMGDVGRTQDGILYITGRRKEMLVVGGFNVYPAEVEEVLRESDSVLDVVVVGLPDDRLGELPVAGVVWAPGAAGSVDDRQAELATQARHRLDNYKVPRRWFALDEVPLTPNLKVDRTRALEIARERLDIDRF